MIRKRISYQNFNGEQTEKEFCFNWTVDEIGEWQMSTPGGIQQWFDDITSAKSNDTIMGAFRKIVGSSIGERSEDGEDFRKSKKITKRFIASNAYSEMLIEFLENPGEFTRFIEALLPAGVMAFAEKKAEEESKKGDLALDLAHSDSDLLSMPDDEFFALVGTKKISKMKTKQYRDTALIRQTAKRAERSLVEKIAV